jgi:membrane protease YdiL (CAAX protease family)
MLRFSPRTRGAMIGLMSWAGYASMMLFFFALVFIPRVVTMFARVLELLAVLPWPWLRLFLGARPDGSFSFLFGTATCWIFSGLTIGAATWFSAWGAKRGLAGSFSVADSKPRRVKDGAAFGREPLYRKEFLWFVRDRSAIVQAILIPLTVAGFQVFNLRGLLARAAGQWNYLCGAGIFFGTYFLWVLGPRSLSSEGAALWIALTWPRGLENLLKAKAWLWSMISSGLVFLVLCYAAFLYPHSMWEIAFVGAGWFFFGRSMAEKTVTLVSVTSSSGEPERIPWGRRGAAQLGMLTFCIGVISAQWHIAVMGIVYSYMTAAAMWQNFRARLSFLYDPWSEKLPPPPTLMHAMIAISILVEGGAVVTGLLLAFTGREHLAVAQAISYGVCAVIVSLGVSKFLDGRGVSFKDIWRWSSPTQENSGVGWPLFNVRSLAPSLLLGASGGVLLGFFAHGYLVMLKHLPSIAVLIQRSQEPFTQVPNLRIAYAIMAIGFAPLAEEYLFRGLLFRSLDREWGGWRAIFGSAAFFAVYHAPLSWLPVAVLGAANAVVFKRTGRLAPAVILHAVYNAIVVACT